MSTDYDSLPLTRFYLEPAAPCMNPRQHPTTGSQQFYPLEYDRKDACSLEIATNLTSDPRYLKLGESISEYDLQRASGVLDILRGQELSSDSYSPNIDSAKRATSYSFYVRPTLPWKLSCEAAGTGR